MKTIFPHQTKMLEHQNLRVKCALQGPSVRGSQPWAVTARLRRHGVTNYITGGPGVIPPGEHGNLCSLQSTVLRKGCAAITFQVIASPRECFLASRKTPTQYPGTLSPYLDDMTCKS